MIAVKMVFVRFLQGKNKLGVKQ